MILINRASCILAAGIILVAGMFCGCGKTGGSTGEEDSGGGGGGGEQTDIPVKEISTLKVMSFNILRGDLQSPEHDWTVRREACLEMIAQEEPMLFGLQECTWTQRRHILASNKLLGAVGVAVDGQTKDYTNVSSNPIFWRKDILELQEWGTFWLSDTPDATGSITWNGVKPRTCTWARLKVRCSSKQLYYFNAHVENAAGEETKKKSIRLIIDRMQEKNPSGAIPMLFGGDMNSLCTAACIKPMMNYLHHAPTGISGADTGRTFNGFKETGGSAIDHLFYNDGPLTGLMFMVDRNAYKDVTYISDHYPVFCELQFN